MAAPETAASQAAYALSIARNTYEQCADCPGRYEILKDDTRRLVNILEDLERIARKQQLNERRAGEFQDNMTTCSEVLKELGREVESFNNLGAPTRRMSDRVRWDEARVSELDEKLLQCAALLERFLENLVMSSHAKLESILMALVEDIHNGRPPPQCIASVTAVPDDAYDARLWPGILRELEEIGIPQWAADENRTFILAWLRDAKPDLTSPPNSETGTSSHSNGLSVSEQFGRRSSATTTHGPFSPPPPPHSFDGTLKYMDAFGDFGEETEADVRKTANTFKEDINRSREYWVRSNWAEVKRNLLRVMIGAQLPNHRRADIDARTAAFLLGVACSNSGDFEAAKLIFFSVLEPWPKKGAPDEMGPFDDAQIAAATWLGDTCLKTNRVEDGAMAWCIALDALRRRDMMHAQMRGRLNAVTSQGSSPMTPPSSPPSKARFSMRHPSLDMPNPAAAHAQPGISGPSAQARFILSELVLVNRGTGNLHSLLEGLESGWYPSMTDSIGSIFANDEILSQQQMRMLVGAALEAAEQADDRNAMMGLYKTQSGDAIGQMVLCKRQNILRLYATKGRVDSMILPDAVLRSPTMRGVWPMMYDVDFSYLAAVTALEYIHGHTSLKEEGVDFNIPILDSKQSKQLVAEKGKPIYLAQDLKPKDRKDVERFIQAVRATLASMHFHVLEAPAEFRCQPQVDYPHPRWATVASLSVRVIGYHPKAIFEKPKLACYVSDIVHWDGRHEAQDTQDKYTSELIKEMYYSLAMRHQAERGNVLPGGGPQSVSVPL